VQVSSAAWIWVGVAFALGSAAQAITGFGFALIAIPLASLVLSPTDAVVAQTLAGSLISFVMAWQYRTDLDRPTAARVTPWMIAGMPFGLLVATQVSDDALRLSVGVCVIGAAIAIATGVRIRSHRVRLVDGVAGAISGVLATTTGTNGPPLVITLAGRDTPPLSFRSTLQFLFALGNLVSLPLFAAAGQITSSGTRAGAIAIVPTVAGRLFGERIFRRLNPESFRTLVLVMLFLAGAVAITRSVV
jgi:uncharacterized protein